jgi:hypothetical protein
MIIVLIIALFLTKETMYGAAKEPTRAAAVDDPIPTFL